METEFTPTEVNVAFTIGEMAGMIHIDGGVRADKKARNMAQSLAEDVAAMAMFSLPKMSVFRNMAGKIAADHVRKYS